LVGINSISVLGLGLIGGSIAKAIKDRTGVEHIYAYSRTYKDVLTAYEDGVVTRPFRDIDCEFLNTDILFICTPVSDSVEILKKYRDMFGRDTIITDTGSTKDEISKTASELGLSSFIGGHPMAGSEKTGYGNSAAHMFENAFYILTVNDVTDEEKLKKMIYIVTSIGAIPIILNAGEHDFITAAISHIPHIAAASLVSMAEKLNKKDNNIERLAAGGFKDLTRIASSSPAMWQSICMQNAKNIDFLLEMYIKELEQFRSLVNGKDPEKLSRFFEDAKDFRDGMKEKTIGQYNAYYDISVDIVDKPGAIAEVAVILAERGINVKNINIPASREFEEGCLTVSLEDESSRIHAISALNKSNIRAYKK
jgi:prephenate dehydrogenase